jgi:DNA (cytosine-5)-methyltransferase 1
MDNRKISSQNNVHPGHFLKVNREGEKVFSDPRALTLYELMCVMTIPKNWQVPSKTPEAFLRSVIGEGIPPLFLKQVFMQLVKKGKND